ncbi:MAG: hypothetical protein JOZ96_17865 [Acidobacteria bacterium]|nr:hypothetical protein [Acidobacteriota bacterium]
MLKVYGELGVDVFQHKGPEKIKEAITQVRGVFDLTNSVYGVAAARAGGNRSLAFANALEGLVTLSALPFEINPGLKTLPAYRMIILPLDRAVTGIKITERLIEAGKLSDNLDLLLENQRKLNGALIKVQELQKAYESSEQGRSMASDESATKSKSTNANKESITEALNKFEKGLDDAIDQWGYKEQGDRYFDGRPGALANFLEKHPEYKSGVRPEFPPDSSNEGKGDSAGSDDGEMYEDDDAADMFGYMMEGERYFANRPKDFERFKERYPYYKELTWEALAASERAESYRRAMAVFNSWKERQVAEYHGNCTKAETDYQRDMKSEQQLYDSFDADCNNPVLSLADSAACHAEVEKGRNSMLKSLANFLKAQRTSNYCGHDDEMLRFLDQRKPRY